MLTRLLGLSLREGLMLPPGLVLDMIQVQKPGAKEENTEDGYEDD